MYFFEYIIKKFRYQSINLEKIVYIIIAVMIHITCAILISSVNPSDIVIIIRSIERGAS